MQRLKRLKKEYRPETLSLLDNIGIVCVQEPFESDTAVFSFQGPVGTPYEKGIFTVSLSYPCDYPFKPVKVRFMHPVLHPSIDESKMDWTLMKDNWCPGITVDILVPALLHYLTIIDEKDYENFKTKFEVPHHLRHTYTRESYLRLLCLGPCWKLGTPRALHEEHERGGRMEYNGMKTIGGKKYNYGYLATDDVELSLVADLNDVVIGCSPWISKVKDLAIRGLTVDQLLYFCEILLSTDTPMPHFDPFKSTTRDVVRGAIIPLTRDKQCSYAQLVNVSKLIQPEKMVTHHWNNPWLHTISAVIADALDVPAYASIVNELSTIDNIGILKRKLDLKGRLHDSCYWICAMSVNQHQSICGGFGPPQAGLPFGSPEYDSVNGLVYSLCDCGASKHFDGSECEMNKFDEMIRCLRKSNPKFSQIVAIDKEFEIFTRAWCVAELVESKQSKCTQQLKVYDIENIESRVTTLEHLDVIQCQSSRPEDKEAILSKIGDVARFNTFLRDLVLGPRDESGRRNRGKGLFFKQSQSVMAWCINPEAGSALIEGRKYFDAAVKKHTAKHAILQLSLTTS